MPDTPLWICQRCGRTFANRNQSHTCHPVGDLCTTDTDCCGATGINGGSTKPVTCDMSGGGSLGVCRLPMGCKPNGAEPRNCLARGHEVYCNLVILSREDFWQKKAA